MNIKLNRISALLCFFIALLFMLVPNQIGVGQGCLNEVTTAGAESCDGSASFTVTMQDVVAIDVTDTTANGTIIRSALDDRYLPITGNASLALYAVTDFTVSGLLAITNGTSDGLLPNALIEVSVLTASTDEGDGDDPSSLINGNTLDGAGTCTIANQGGTCQDLSTAAAVNLFDGGNSAGGTNTFHTVTVGFRLDKDALGNASTATTATANVFTFTVTFTITEN